MLELVQFEDGTFLMKFQFEARTSWLHLGAGFLNHFSIVAHQSCYLV